MMRSYGPSIHIEVRIWLPNIVTPICNEFMELRDPAMFEKNLCKRFRPKHSEGTAKSKERRISFGSAPATTPYQPAERRFRITRKIT